VPRAEVVEAQVMHKGAWKALELEPSVLLESGLDGEPILHLKGSGARSDMDVYGPDGAEALRAIFEVRF